MGCRILAGSIYGQDLSVANQPLLPFGNCQAVLNIEEEEQTLPDYESLAGGNACSDKAISSVELALTFYDFKAENIALAVFGTKTAVNSGTVTNEAVSVFAGGAFNPVAHIMTGSIVLSSAAPVATYVQDTDFVSKGGGFVVKAGSTLETNINNSGTGTPKRLACEIDYAYGAENVVEALKTSGKNYRILIDGSNRANNASKEMWDLWKVQFGPVSGLSIITREFGNYELTAAVLPDTTRPANESPYFRIRTPQ